MTDTTKLIAELRQRLDAEEQGRQELLQELRRGRAAEEPVSAHERMRRGFEANETRVAEAQPATRREAREVRNAPREAGDE